MGKIKLCIVRTLAKLPERFIPASIQNGIGKIAEKEIEKTKANIIKMRWQQMQLENQINEYKAKQ